MKIGDKVRFLSEVGGGVVSGFQGKDIVLVQDEDGFDIPMPVRECVVVATDDYGIPTQADKAEKKRKKLREDEMQILNSQTAFKARLADDLKDIDFILSDPKISSVIVQVPDDKIAEFARSIHTEDLADYDVQQYENQADMFKISKKLITF